MSDKKDQPAQQNLADPIAFASAMMEAYEKARPILEKHFEQNLSEDLLSKNLDPLNINPIYAQYIENLISNPEKFWEMQTEYWSQWFDIWRNSTLKFLGDEDEATPQFSPGIGDRRFKDPDWQNNAVFDYIKQSYLMTCNWIDESIRNSNALDDKQKDKLAFTAKLYADALSPTNFAYTNPEVLKETISTGGKNLIKGFENLINDLERGHGNLQISTTNYQAFEVGKNLAITKGSVVFENDMMQLIQYAPTTKKVFQKPLLIIPPWINKYYILDIKPNNSFIKWACDQGHTVFIISWVNPTKKHAEKGFEDYMLDGIISALNQIEEITDEEQCNAIGYCLGGTLLSITLAYLKDKNMDQRMASATFLTTLLDFEKSGDLKLFLDEEQIKIIDKQLEETGIFDAKTLQQTFKLLRANDLIWSFVINNYLMGREPFPFDLLYWNDDSTHMPAKMQSFYLRNMYRDNLLYQSGGITISDTEIDLTTINTPSYFLSTKEDHIAPWQATYNGPHLFSSKDKTFTLAASGHIAGVVNPPAKEKYCYWTNKKLPKDPQEWLEDATETPGSWWPHWQKWITKFAGEKVNARAIKNEIEAAPGSFVKEKAL